MSALKQIRGQLRQIAKELLPELLEQELFLKVELKLRKELQARLEQIDKRQAEVQSYIIRQSAPIVKRDEEK